PAQSLQTDAFILLKRPPTDAFQSFSAFSAEHGALHILQRVAKKSATTSVVLDLFDEASLLLDSSTQGQTYFVKEARLITRQTQIGKTYEALRLASSLTTLNAPNHVDADSRAAIAELLRHALVAFGSTARSDIVYFKSLYRF